MRVLKDRIAPVGLQSPAAGEDHFVAAVQRFVAGDEVEDRLRVRGRAALTLDPSPIGWERGSADGGWRALTPAPSRIRPAALPLRRRGWERGIVRGAGIGFRDFNLKAAAQAGAAVTERHQPLAEIGKRRTLDLELGRVRWFHCILWNMGGHKLPFV